MFILHLILSVGASGGWEEAATKVKCVIDPRSNGLSPHGIELQPWNYEPFRLFLDLHEYMKGQWIW